ncbi:MAG: hypothetical protein ACYCS9_07835 [Candidatus Dormibacteria bacterium]
MPTTTERIRVMRRRQIMDAPRQSLLQGKRVATSRGYGVGTDKTMTTLDAPGFLIRPILLEPDLHTGCE